MKIPICCPDCGAHLGHIDGKITVVPNVPSHTTFSIPISDIEWPKGHQTRILSMCRSENIHTIGDLISKTEAELLRCPNVGQLSLKVIKAKLSELGLHIGLLKDNW
jgi:DNA-directed RNA polymerase alpha subunit